MVSTSSLKQMAKMALRLAALAPFALLAAAACSSSPPAQSTACGAVAQCPVNQACYNYVCTPIQNGSGGGSSTVSIPVPGSGGGTSNPAGAGAFNNPAGAGTAGVTGIPGGG